MDTAGRNREGSFRCPNFVVIPTVRPEGRLELAGGCPNGDWRIDLLWLCHWPGIGGFQARKTRAITSQRQCSRPREEP